jgi:anti-sigma factor RsiW
MECRTVRSKLSSLIDGELPHDDARAAREHLRRCRTCALEYRDLVSAWELVAGIPRIKPSAELLPSIKACMAEAPAAGFLQMRRWVFPALATAMCAAGITIGVLLGGWMQAGNRAPLARTDETPGQIQNFQSIRHFSDAPPGSLAEGILVPSSSSGKRGNEP